MYGATLPVERGYISSLAHPAGNITGTSGSGVEMVAKYIQILREVAPTLTRLALLTTPRSSDRRRQAQGALAGADELDEVAHKSYVDAMVRTAVALGMTSETFDVETSEDITSGLERIAASRAQMLWVSYDGVIQSRLRDITSFAMERKILSIGVVAPFTSVGGALYYGPNSQEILDRSVSFIDRILRGAKPGDLPVEEPTTFDLIINMKTMRAIGITVPQSVLVRATGLIE
jgi:putative ABC transport system substrate-binding protein